MYEKLMKEREKKEDADKEKKKEDFRADHKGINQTHIRNLLMY